MRWRLLAGALLGTFLTACVDAREEASPASSSKEVFTEHRFQKLASPSKGLGESCLTGGTSECRTGLCLHYLPGPSEGWVCSASCQSEAQCPVAWSCLSIFPSDGARFCIPPKTWVPAAALPRAGAEVSP